MQQQQTHAKQPQNTHTQHTRYMVEIARTVTVKNLDSWAREYLEEHGCTLTNAGGDATMVSYPSGTTRQELLSTSPHTIPGINYRVCFPDGFELREVQAQGTRYRELYVPKQ
jgi:hypothetical protein